MVNSTNPHRMPNKHAYHARAPTRIPLRDAPTDWPTLADRYDQRFHRMFKHYLHAWADHFRSRQGQP